MKPRIAVLSLGGTIAMGREAGEGGVVPSLDAQDLTAAVPSLTDIAELEVDSFRNIPSTHLNFDDLTALADKIRQLEEAGVQGVVITQGTDTIEETSWMLDLMLSMQIPVVVTGAMRNPTQPGADGPANLLASVQVACSESARNLGVLVVFNDDIHAARYVSKTHTSNVATFQSPGIGRLGWLSEGIPSLPFGLRRTAAINVSKNITYPHVSILQPGIGEDTRLIEASLSLGVEGLVIEAAGGGHTSGIMADALARLTPTIPVILASRTGSGEILKRSYGFVGGEMDLLSRGLIPAGVLIGSKARILLIFLLCNKVSTEEIRQAFLHYGGGGSDIRVNHQKPRQIE